MSCQHDCEKPAEFPKTIDNRPGLPLIDYRIGAYAELRARMLHLLNQAPTLSGWTHRGADDPGIALLESTAVVGDILTFYQQLYANEQYLRTAQWRESVAELVRLLGYRLAPGIGGEATFAIAVKGTEAVSVPAGFGLKAQLEGGAKPAEFETTTAITAYPHMNLFNLYRPYTIPAMVTGMQNLRAYQVPEGMSFEEGDRVLLGRPVSSGSRRFQDPQILIVEKSWEELGRRMIQFKTPIKVTGSASQFRAFKLGESYRHFGHNAPGKTVTPTTGSYTTANTNYRRRFNVTTTVSDPSIEKLQFPLAEEVDSVAAGDYVIVDARFKTSASDTTPTRYVQERKVTDVENGAYTWGMLSGASTVLTIDAELTVGSDDGADIRTITIHHVIGASFALYAESMPTAAATGNQLYFFGTQSQADTFDGRSLLFMQDDGEALTASVTDVESLSASLAETIEFRRLTLDQNVVYGGFLRATPTTTVYGNLLTATQGRTQDEVVLGSGDNRETFQTFAIPAAPLTYLLDETQTPAQVPELTVYVDGIEWTQVDSFFNYGPNDAVYIVRQDEDDKSYVQFGDGKSGRRLPSGISNVKAIFRVGNAASGPLKDGAKASIASKLKDFDKLHLPVPVTIGTERESADSARVAAPGKMQSLGRMVSLADIEAEAQALPNVLKVRARWAAPEGVPLVRITVLTESGESADVDAVRSSMATYNRYRGPARYPISVVQGVRQYVYLNIQAGYDPTRREDDVKLAIKQALGVLGEEANGLDGSHGLFGLSARQFGENAHKSQIIGAVQNATGVTWVTLVSAQPLDLGSPVETDPLALDVPTADAVQPVLACTDDRILTLYSTHLVLSLTQDTHVPEVV